MIFRLVQYSSPDARLNEALEEAMLIARRKEQPLDTIRLWQNSRAVVLGNSAIPRGSVDVDACQENQVAIVRRASSGPTMFQDQGTINLTYVVDRNRFLPNAHDLTAIYTELSQAVAEGITRLGADAEVDDYGRSILAGDQKISEAWVNFYYDFVQFQLSINVNTNLTTSGQVLLRKEHAANLSAQVDRSLLLQDIETLLIDGITRRFGAAFEKQGFSRAEEKLSERLYEVKYSKDDWNFHGNAPLSLKGVLVDVYVAYPPTTSCRAIIENLHSAIADFRDKVEVRIWMAGKGLDGEGHPSGVVMPGGLLRAMKESIIPAVIINGDISFSRTVPSREDLRSEILQVLRGSD